jgi:hypothetical protein
MGRITNVLADRSTRKRGSASTTTAAVSFCKLPYRDLPVFMLALREREAVAARALEFAILTAARTGEVIGARWSEIDLGVAAWTSPRTSAALSFVPNATARPRSSARR